MNSPGTKAPWQDEHLRAVAHWSNPSSSTTQCRPASSSGGLAWPAVAGKLEQRGARHELSSHGLFQLLRPCQAPRCCSLLALDTTLLQVTQEELLASQLQPCCSYTCTEPPASHNSPQPILHYTDMSLAGFQLGKATLTLGSVPARWDLGFKFWDCCLAHSASWKRPSH